MVVERVVDCAIWDHGPGTERADVVIKELVMSG